MDILAALESTSQNTTVEFIENPEIVRARLQKIQSALAELAKEHLPIMAYGILIDAAINHLEQGQNKIFYFPIPWEKDTGLPSHPSLIADARYYCRNNSTAETKGLIVDSFAEWRLFQKTSIFCCCGKGSVCSRERIVPIEIVIHHPIHTDGKANILEIKQLVGIKSADREHTENHYDLRQDSRVNSNISIVSTSSVKISLTDFQLMEQSENYAKQFNFNCFRKIFTEMCKTRVISDK